jgi:hypothetical protein
MQREIEELQNPNNPVLIEGTNRRKKSLRDLAMDKDKSVREAFLNNTKTLNNSFAFGSITAEHAPRDQCGSRPDTCKYNGEISFHISDLKAPPGKTPLFCQSYTITADAATKIRKVRINFF